MNAKDKQKLQRMFDKAVRGLKSQKWKQSTRNGGDACKYRGDNGRRCAIGWLIPNSKYTEAIEGKTVLHDRVRRLLGVSPKLAAELQILQSCHDWSNSPSEMKERLRRFALTAEISPSVLGRGK